MPATFGLLFQHNVQIELALWRRTLFEWIIVIIMLILILANPIFYSKRALYSRTDYEGDQTIVSHKLDDINILTSLVDSKREQTKYKLAYSPDTPFVKRVVDVVTSVLELNNSIGYNDPETLQNQFDERTMLAAVVFDRLDQDPDAIPKVLSVSIRFPSEFRTISPFLTEDRLWLTRCSGVVNSKRDNAKDSDINQDIYIREGFLQLQHQVFLAWFHMLRSQDPSKATEPQTEVFNVRLRVANERCSTMDFDAIPSFLFNFIYLLPFINVIRSMAAQMKDNVMTHQWHYGYSFCKQYTCIMIVLMLRLLCLGLIIMFATFIYWSVVDGIFSPIALLSLIVFVIIITLELILTAIIIAKIFKDVVNAVLFAIIIWAFNYAVFGLMLKRYWDLHGPYVYFILMIFFSNQIPYFMQMIHRLIDEPGTLRPIDYFSPFVSGLVYILVSIGILCLLQWRMPGRLLSRRMIYKRCRKHTLDNTPIHLGRTPSWHNFEFGDVGSSEIVRLRHIFTAHRTSERKILKNISIRLYVGEIYVLLGHMGSGKLTLLRVLCGLKYPLRGHILYMGEDIYEDIRRSRKFVDFRSYENGLFPHLSIEKTINYHVKLKQSDWDSDRYKSECKKWLDLIETHIAERWQPIDTLTYGEKRVVALCCAIAGDTKLIVFEEPTKDMTAREAKIFWNIVSAEKEDHAFLVATHSIDETDAIADRIGILSMGVLEASGTPFFLRSKFSSFVELIIIKKPHVSDTPITDFIANYIPETEPENEIGDTLTYKINARHRPRLQKMLIHLENERKKLGIENVQVVGSEMSDIYMKLATSFRLQQQIIPDVTQTFKYSVVSKKKLKKQQVRAMFYKKMIHTAPNVWPVVMIFSCFFLIVVITRLAIVLNVPNVRKNSIPIGFLGSEEFLKTIPNINNCGYIEIKTVTNVPTYRKANGLSRTFDANSFSCEQGQYRHTLAKKVELTSLGAVEQGGQQDISGYISQDTFHSAPMLLNLLHNIIIQLSYTNKTDYATLVDSHPMPTPLTMKINLLDNEIAHINAPLAVGCILPLVISIFIIPIVEEHICGLRVLQVIAGLRLQIYWGVNLLWDIFTYLIYSIIIVIIVACTNVGDFGIIENLMLLLLLFVYGLAALPITYVVSMYMNRSMVRAFLVSVLFQGLTGLVLYIVYWDVANSNVIFFYGACLSPGFSLLDGISNIYIRCLEKRLCQTKCAAVKNCQPHNMHEMVPRCNFDTYFKWADSGVLPALTFMILASAIALLLIFWIELHRREKKFHSSKNLNNMRTATYHFDDSDVADVKQKIAEADMSKCKQSVFLVDQVEAKIPAKGNRLNTISFALNKYMSMGIFGPRRSGKSHLIRQLVGVDGFAFGEIYVRGLDFKYDIDTILGYVGYCPQHYGLLNELTPREHIRLLCMIRGVPEDKIKEKIHDICLMLNMTGWMHRKCGVLTPEKRRKVNVSLSLVAYNKIFILDEPTCGMPSTTRREIWNILRYLRYCGKTIIFASNDELECKVLADFVVLFQDSEMLAIGSMQYLRYKYSHGFYLEVRLVRDGSTKEESEANLRKDVENLARFIHFLHDKAEVVGHMHNWFKYYIPVGHIVYSFLYGALEKNKVRLNIYDYSIYGANMNIVIAQVQETRAELKRKMEPKVDNDDRVKRSTNKFFSHLYH
ncbi:ATP-binding cassette sub-family A member 3 [Drosophila navojoa]|uniref:ATP-binding cassette sub-family A member 3 n=1 Tax=Drosophila navojoa TaxID=7232 RepID=UPI0011BE9210|nr:ATP-binding cassette sub-family A member 3 [Drosophila navojoa]